MTEIAVIILALAQLHHSWCHLRDAKDRLREAEERAQDSAERQAYWQAQKEDFEKRSREFDVILAKLRDQ